MLFQSTPAFSGEGTSHVSQLLGTGPVSIHPRLFRRGNDQDVPPEYYQYKFQSTPAFSGEGTFFQDLPNIRASVSIHPRLFRRGNSQYRFIRVRRMLVSIHPRLFRRGNDFRIVRTYTVLLFQSTPAFSGEGTTDAVVDVFAFWVSIHPRLFRRGNCPAASQ